MNPPDRAGEPSRLFHGTGQDIDGKVLPGNAVGRRNWSGYRTVGNKGIGHYAFASGNEDDAWYFAQTASGLWHGSSPMKRARVYEVAPHPEQVPGYTTKATLGLTVVDIRTWTNTSLPISMSLRGTTSCQVGKVRFLRSIGISFPATAGA